MTLRPALLLAVLLAVPLSVLAPTSSWAEDGVFTVPTLSQARNKAGDERLVVVFITEDGDADCAFMEAEAWTHPDVKTWVDSHAIAAKVDARSFHGASLQGRYGVDKLPALLAFRGDTLARSHEGPLDGSKLLAWLEIVRIGDMEAAEMLASTSEEPASKTGAVDIDARMVDALEAPNPMTAASILMGAWRETLETPQHDSRRPRIIDALGPYMINQEAHDLVSRERDASWSRHKRHKSLPDLLDWMALNHLLEEDAATIRWVEGARVDKKGREWLRRVMQHEQDPLLALLAGRGDWKTIGQSIGDPAALVKTRKAVHAATKVTITGAESKADREALQLTLASIVVGLLADGRDREARDVSDGIVAEDKAAGPIIVQTAISARQPRRWMRALLNPNKAEQVQLAMDLTKALQDR